MLTVITQLRSTDIQPGKLVSQDSWAFIGSFGHQKRLSDTRKLLVPSSSKEEAQFLLNSLSLQSSEHVLEGSISGFRIMSQHILAQLPKVN